MEICIIKLGADGDVLRTLPIATAIKKQKKDARITWITKGDIASIVAMCPDVDIVKTVPYKTGKKFDEVYNFDVDAQALETMKLVNGEKKFGFFESEGYPSAYNSSGEYYLNTMFDDELKKSNKKTYQEIMFGVAELKFDLQNSKIYLDDEVKKYAKDFKIKNKVKDARFIGIHMGSSNRWPSKAWHSERVEEFIEKMSKDYEIILFAGPNEIDKQRQLIEKLKYKNINVLSNDPENTKREFLSLVSLCDYIVCADSLALHAALILGKRTVALFFVTSPDEVEGYGLLKKIVSKDLYAFFPEKSNVYDENLTKSIEVKEVIKCINEWEHKE